MKKSKMKKTAKTEKRAKPRKAIARSPREIGRTHMKQAMSPAKIKVVGVGGGGGNAVSRMCIDFLRGVEFVAINTDAQDLDCCPVKAKIHIGKSLTRGLGTGMNPDLGKQAAEENRSEIAAALEGSDIVFITAGLGGGTGTGAAPVVAEVAKQLGALTIGVVTKPFTFEGSQRMKLAQEGLMKLKDKVDALIVVPNDRIFSVIEKDTSILKAFQAIDDVLRNAVQGIVDVIVMPGMINLDFSDLRVVIQDAGMAIIGVGSGTGAERANIAVNQAINSPLLEASIDGAKGVLFGIFGGRDMKMNEINEVARLIAEAADPAAKIIFGAYHDRRLKDKELKVVLIATGFNGSRGAGSLFSATPFDSLIPKGNGGRENKDQKAMKEAAPVATLASTELKEEKNEAKEKKDKGDIFDIPTFLRRKR